MLKFEKAVKRKKKLKMAFTGIAGSGKTRSALILAFSMFEKVCVIDTERGTASLYADIFPRYDTYDLRPPYSPDRYIEAIKAAEEAGYDCVIIDSLSHEWNKSGGCLQMVDAVAKTTPSNNTFTAWGKVTPKHDALIDYIISSNINVIATLRADTQYEIVENAKGQKVPVKIGLSPVQRKDFDYEFDIVFDLLSDRSHRFMCSKDRTTIKITPIEGNNFTCYTESLFGDSEIPILLDDTVGKKITFWLENGAEIAEAKKETPKTEIQKNIEIKARELYKEINNPTVKFEEAKNRWNEFISIDSIENIGEEIQSAFNKLLNKKEINEMPSASQKFDNEPAQAVNY